METVKLSTKGQLVIPKEIRDALHLAAGTEFAVSFVGNEIRLTPLPAERRPRPVQTSSRPVGPTARLHRAVNRAA